MSLAIYCFARNEGGAEQKKLNSQVARGHRYAYSIGRTDRDCVIYREVSAEVPWAKRPNYERMKQDISDGKVDEVWAFDSTRLYPFSGEKESFEALCKSKGVRVSFGSGTHPG
jgi:DNA invertase Pin-like site-specific DNA recombinase